MLHRWTQSRAKEDPETRHIPIFAISSYTLDEEERELIGRRRFDRFLVKPIEPRNLVADVEAWIGPPGL